MAGLIKDHPLQKTFYQPGIGTYTSPNFLTPFTQRIAKVLDLALAWYLPSHVQTAYKFIVDNFDNPDDRIILIGFSRGAYACRALAGMIQKVGLIPKNNDELVSFAWNLYTSKDSVLAADFKAVTSRSVSIDQLLLFDTVSSVGVINTKQLPFTGSNRTIRYFSHAMSLGERRVRFAQNPWQIAPTQGRTTPDITSQRLDWLLFKEGQTSTPVDPPSPECAQTQVRQMYFLGDHTDVGGGRIRDTDQTKTDISLIPLRWMVEEMLLNAPSDTIKLDPIKLQSYGIPYPVVRVEEERPWYADLAKEGLLHDKLKERGWAKWAWWLLEIVPLKQNERLARPIDDKAWDNTWKPHFGRYRSLPDGAYLHKSVHHRIHAETEAGLSGRVTVRDRLRRYHENVKYLE